MRKPIRDVFRALNAMRIAISLSSFVFNSGTKHGAELAAKISTDMVFVNRSIMVRADLPFGGICRSSGYLELPGGGLKEFVNVKLVKIDAEL